MSETGAMIGWDTLFEISRDDGATWAEVAEVFDITPPSAEIDDVDATHMKSPDRTREFIAGLTDPGECTFEMNFVPGSDSDALIREIRATGERVSCRITFPNDVTWTFSGILKRYNPAVPTENRMTASVAFRVSGSTVVGP